MTFNQQNNCDGLNLSNFSFSITSTGVDNKGNPVVMTTAYNFDVKESSSAPRSGVYQDYAGKAQMEFFFYNGSDDEGGVDQAGNQRDAAADQHDAEPDQHPIKL